MSKQGKSIFVSQLGVSLMGRVGSGCHQGPILFYHMGKNTEEAVKSHGKPSGLILLNHFQPFKHWSLPPYWAPTFPLASGNHIPISSQCPWLGSLSLLISHTGQTQGSGFGWLLNLIVSVEVSSSPWLYNLYIIKTPQFLSLVLPFIF